MTRLALGIDIGGGSVKAAVVNEAGFCQNETSFSVSSQTTGAEMLLGLEKLIDAGLSLFPSISRIGIGSPGPLDAQKGILLESANLPLLKNLALKTHLQDKFHLPVHYNNDANCAALAESRFGTGKYWESCLVLTLGTGIGGGFVDRGKLFQGYQGNGIEIGHTTVVIGGDLCGCGERGCVESYFSTKGLLNRFEARTNEKLPNAKSFFDQVRSGDSTSKEILDFGVTCLAESVRSAIHLLNPEGVAFVGGITEAWDLFGKSLESQIRAKIFPVLEKRLKIAVGASLSGIQGAGALALFSENME